MAQPNLYFSNLILFLNFEIERSNLNNNNVFLILIVIVATIIATGRRTKKRKRVFKKKRFGSRHHSYSGKLWKTIKIRQVCEKQDFGSGSRLRIGKVSPPYNARPRAVPLIKDAELM